MTERDRVRLAEAMGVDPNLFGPLWGNPIFDPFKDANHDYAVLEWMRAEEKRMEFPRYVGALSGVMQNRLAASHAANYRIGDYARAALKVLRA